ncbi:MAG: hypothetical protein AABY32_02780 [Nanoarchaeota archaeon]
MTYSQEERLELKEKIKRLYFVEKRGLIEVSNILNISHPVVKELINEVKEEIREDYKQTTVNDLLMDLRLQFNEINKRAWVGVNETNDHRCKIGYLKIIQNNSQLLIELVGFNNNRVSREELIKLVGVNLKSNNADERYAEEVADEFIKEMEIKRIRRQLPSEYDEVMEDLYSEDKNQEESLEENEPTLNS